MASPQIEDGYTRIANELFAALTTADLSRRDLVILLHVIRETYGFQRKLAPLKPADVARATGFDRHNVGRSLRGLESSGVIVRVGSELGVQKNYKRWSITWRVDPAGGVQGTPHVTTNGVHTTPSWGSGNPAAGFTQPRHGVQGTPSWGSGNPERGAGSSDSEDVQDPKERKKERKNFSDQHAREPFGLTDDHLAQLRDSLEGIPWVAMGIKPENLRARLRGLMDSKLKPYGDDVRAAWDDCKPLDVQVSWIVKAMALAKSKCSHNSGVLPYAAGVIVGCLARGQDLLTEDDAPPARQGQPSAPAPVPVKRSTHKYADRSWWRDWMDSKFVTDKDSFSAWTVARTVRDRDGIVSVDPERIQAVCEAEGIDAAMAALFAAIREHVQATRASAG